MLWISLEPFINNFRKNRLGIPPIRRGEHGWNLLNTNKVPFAKMWSKYLVPKPKDWESHIDVVGFFLDKSALPSRQGEPGDQINPWNRRPLDQRLPEAVRNFLLNGPPPIFVGFGSMVVENPLSLIQVRNIWSREEIANVDSLIPPQVFIEAAASLGLRIIFQSGWTEMNPDLFNSFCREIEGKVSRKGPQGVKALKDIFERHTRGGSGLQEEPASYLNHLWTMTDALLIGACSHDSLFPHVAAVVHHGGAGLFSSP
jgi:hypothetical protein